MDDTDSVEISTEGMLGRGCSFCNTRWIFAPANEAGAMAYATGHSALEHPVELSTVLVEKGVDLIIKECDAFVKAEGFTLARGEVATEPDTTVYVVLRNDRG